MSADFTFDRDGDAVTGTLPMTDADTGEDAGQASFSAVLDPIGAPVVSDASPQRGGNIVDRGYRTEQDAVVSGVLRLADGSEFVLDGCPGTVGEVVVVHNTPKTVVEHLPPQTFAACLAPGAGGYTLAFLLLAEHGETFAMVDLLPPDWGDPLVIGFGDVTLDRTALTGTLALFGDDGEPAGEAVVDATVEAGKPRIVKGQEGDINFHNFVRDSTLRGEVSVTGFGAFSLDGACQAGYERGFVRYPNPQA